jgi:hypothetical protein
MNKTCKRRLISSIVAASAALSNEMAHAISYCSGNVDELLVMSNGQLIVHTGWRSDWTAICSTKGDWRNISMEVCMTWYGLVTTAKIHNRPILIYYTTDVTCASLPTYESAPTPQYVRLQ